MAKLVDLLAKYLVEWPDGAKDLTQGKSGNLYNQESEIAGFIEEIAENQDFDCVTYKDWLATRDRLHAETVKDMRETTNADTDQALWDKVAIAAIGGLTASDIFYNSSMFQYRPDNAAEFASGIADAFMAERAKRLKKAQAHEN